MGDVLNTSSECLWLGKDIWAFWKVCAKITPVLKFGRPVCNENKRFSADRDIPMSESNCKALHDDRYFYFLSGAVVQKAAAAVV